MSRQVHIPTLFLTFLLMPGGTGSRLYNVWFYIRCINAAHMTHKALAPVATSLLPIVSDCIAPSHRPTDTPLPRPLHAHLVTALLSVVFS